MTTATEPAAIKPLSVQEVHSHLHPDPSWDIADHPIPTGREEVWRFSPIRQMQAVFAADATPGTLAIETRLPQGATWEEISPELAQQLSVDPPIDRVAALAAKNAVTGWKLAIAAGAELAEPVEVDFTGTGLDTTVCGHLIVEVGASANAVIVLRHGGTGNFASKVDIRVGENAQVNFVSVQDWETDSVHGAQISLLIGRDAKVQTVQASMGGGVTRIVERSAYEAPGGELNQIGLYFVNGKRHIEHRMFVDHNQPNTFSNVDYRGALQHQGSRSVWVGDVLIRPQALGINTYESNKNLLLTEGCQADAVPNLEIETGEIEGAGHSASTGRFDDLQLFYLMSRGIPEDEAKRLVVQGFFFDLIRQIGVEDIENRLLHVLDHELDAIAPSLGGNA